MDDAVSRGVQASETDRMLFTVLSNAERLDLSSLPHVSVARPVDEEPRIQEVLASIPEDDTPLPRVEPQVESVPVSDSVPLSNHSEPHDVPALFPAAPFGDAPPPLFDQTLPTAPERPPATPERPPSAAFERPTADPQATSRHE